MRSLLLLSALFLPSSCGDDLVDANEGGAGPASAASQTTTGTSMFAPLVDEAGFVELPASGDGATSRMFYAFRPADVGAEDAPLLVFFNGGPGYATTSLLLPFGTGPATLTERGAVGDAPVDNPASFSRFANLLYLDARWTGFSYDVRTDPIACPYAEPPRFADAGDFVHAVLDVIDARPALTNNPVVLVGESYGGTRAAAMLFALQHHAVPAPEGVGPDLAVALPWLRSRVQQHFDLAFPDDAGATRGPDEVARQFGHQILVQPSLYGGPQTAFQAPYLEADPTFAEFFASSIYWEYDVRLQDADGALLDARAAVAMRDPIAFERLIGVEPVAVRGLSSSERGTVRRDLLGAPPIGSDVASAEEKMRGLLGALPETDAYWLPVAQPCGGLLGNPDTFAAVGDVLLRTGTFITDARYDAVIYTPALPLLLADRLGATVVVDRALPAGASRPGVIHVDGNGYDVDVRFPRYEAGHAVTVSAGAALAEDVEAWLHEVGVFGSR